MLYSQQQLAEMGASNVELARSVAQASLDGGQRVAGLQANFARKALDEGARNLASLVRASDLGQAVSVQAALVEPALQSASTFARELAEEVGRTHGEVTRLFEARAAAVRDDFQQVLEQVATSYPGGSEAAVAAMKNAFAAAGSAYDSMTRAARQVVELAQSGAASPAPASPAPAGRRKATA